MPTNVSVENNFIGGLKTEFTGLNFPENACTAASNCVFSIIGDVLRREGIDYEANFVLQNIDTTNVAVNYYKWNNAGGDGSSQIFVLQVGKLLHFFYSSSSVLGAPLSAQLLTPIVDISVFQAVNNSADVTQVECQFSDGNGYLFVFHPDCDPFYVQFSAAGPILLTGKINLQIRDFTGYIPEPGNPTLNFRPTSLTNEHNYNLQNQGWTNNNTWTTSSTTANLFSFGNNISLLPSGGAPTSETFTVASGLTGVNLGTPVNITWSASVVVQSPGDGNYGGTANGTATGNVTSYTGTTMVINVTSSTVYNPSPGTLVAGPSGQQFTIAASNLVNTINTWHTQIGNYPSNADVWFEYISPQNVTSGSPGTFNPSTMIGIVPLSVSQAPNGHFLLNPFIQDRIGVSGISGVTNTSTTKRPRTGCWFQGRVWYTGVDDSQLPTGDAAFYTWTENIYFSQIVSTIQDFGFCYQQNDPTDNRLFDLLPDDGGVIVIQGSGPIYKLFPIQNGLLVFAANGVWVIRGNSGLGFTANDYSINKISAVKSISSTSYVDVLGLPFFWNSEGIYRVAPSQDQAPYGYGGLTVEPLTVGTILSFYNNIPFDSKRFARGTYDPISYVLSWVYRSTQESSILNRYQFDTVLNLNVHNRAFYPYTVTSSHNFICGVQYIDYPSGSLSPSTKYLISTNTPNQFTFAEERDGTNWVDFHSFDGIGVNYTSNFTTGYKVHGQGFRKWHPIYLNVFSNNALPTAYTFQSIWDYANNTKTGKVSSKQKIFNPITSRTMASGIAWPDTSDFDYIFRRHRVAGHGEVLQLEFTSIPGFPMHIIGWAIPEQINTSA